MGGDILQWSAVGTVVARNLIRETVFIWRNVVKELKVLLLVIVLVYAGSLVVVHAVQVTVSMTECVFIRFFEHLVPMVDYFVKRLYLLVKVELV